MQQMQEREEEVFSVDCLIQKNLRVQITRLLFVLCIIFVLFSCYVILFPPVYQGNVPTPHVKEGKASVSVMHVPYYENFFWEIYGDSRGSSLILYENGVPIGPGNSLHETIRQSGGGAFSHWEKSLFFSASDSSDISANGKEYTFSVPMVYRSWVAYLYFFTLCFLLWSCRKILYNYSLCSIVLQTFVLFVISLAIYCGLFKFSWLWPIWYLYFLSYFYFMLFSLYGESEKSILLSLKSDLFMWIQSITVFDVMLSLVPLFVYIFIPFTWNGADSFCLIMYKLDMVPHWPLLAPLLFKIIESVFGVYLSINFYIFIQIVFCCIATLYALSLFYCIFHKIIVSLFLSVGSAFYLYSNGLYLEGMSLPALVLIMFCSYKLIFLTNNYVLFLKNFFVFMVGALFSYGSQHIGILFWTLIFFALVMLAFVRPIKELAPCVISAGGLLLILFLFLNSLNNMFPGASDKQILGRAGIYYVENVFKSLNNEDEISEAKQDILNWLKRKKIIDSNNYDETNMYSKSLDLVADSKIGLWAGLHGYIDNKIKACNLKTTPDKVMTNLYLASIFSNLKTSLFCVGNSLVIPFLNNSKYVASKFAHGIRDAANSKQFYSSLNAEKRNAEPNIIDASYIEAIGSCLFFSFIYFFEPWLIFLLAFLVTALRLVVSFKNNFRIFVIVISLFCVSLSISVFYSVVLPVFLARYMSYILLMSWAALAFSIAGKSGFEKNFR